MKKLCLDMIHQTALVLILIILWAVAVGPLVVAGCLLIKLVMEKDWMCVMIMLSATPVVIPWLLVILAWSKRKKA